MVINQFYNSLMIVVIAILRGSLVRNGMANKRHVPFGRSVKLPIHICDPLKIMYPTFVFVKHSSNEDCAATSIFSSPLQKSSSRFEHCHQRQRTFDQYTRLCGRGPDWEWAGDGTQYTIHLYRVY
jgi:hypothetical protein